MDPITASLVAALAVGVAGGVTETGKQLIPDAYNALKGIADREPNPDIRSEAIKGIANYAKPELRNFLVRELGTASYHHRIAGSAIGAMRSQDDSFYVRPLLRHLKDSEDKFTNSGFSQALGTLAHLARHEENQDKTEVREFLIGHLEHLKERVARSAMSALGVLGDSKAIPVLTTFVAADSDSARGRAAQSAIDKIRKNEPASKAPAEVNRLRGQVQDLEKQLKGVSDELKAMQARFKAALERPMTDQPETAKK